MRTSDQFYLLAAQSFQDMNDWVNCLRLVAFGQSSSSQSAGGGGAAPQPAPNSLAAKRPLAAATSGTYSNNEGRIDALLDKRISQKPEVTGINRGGDYARSPDQANGLASAQPRSVATGPTANVASAKGGGTCSGSAPQQPSQQPAITTASQAAIAAANALAKTRQRQPSLLGSCKPQPPTDSPFIQAATTAAAMQADQEPMVGNMGCLDTLTPTVRGQLIMGAKQAVSAGASQHQFAGQHQASLIGASQKSQPVSKAPNLQASLDEEEENMLYCSIEDNPSEHNYRVKVIETELSLRCQLKCYQLMASTTISQQYEQLGHFSAKTGAYLEPAAQPVTFYQLIVGPQELTLLNDYAAAASLLKRPASQQQGLWSWPYQCIRRYGFDKDNCFMFEAGRKCTSGPGQFIVQTPKAYNIYQDVVKFVNELRSLSTCTSNEPGNQEDSSATTTTTITTSNGATNLQQREKQQVVVTQIPVTWAPSSVSSSHGINIETADNTTRQQFFDTLRQLESTGGPMQSKSSQSINKNNINNNNNNNENMKSREPASAANSPLSSTTSHNQPSSSSSSAASSPTSVTRTSTQKAARSPLAPISDGNAINKPTTNKCDTNSSTATSEETDESGYEQGDDSVDSSRFKLKSAGCSATRKRQANDSMSSSSSTSSSNAGSPGHSVSRRSTSGASSNCSTASNEQGPSKRSPLITDATQRTKSNGLEAKSTNSSSHKLSGLHSLIVEEALGGQPEDFEANLIRDVYSEITKLHAKFAVTSGSAEDLMSSNSSNNGSRTSSNNSCSSHNGDAEECGGGTLSSNGTALNSMNEPMYTNLKLVNGRRARSESFVHLIDNDEDDEEEGDDDDLVVLDGGRGCFGVHSRLQHASSYSHDNISQSRVPQHPSYAQNQFDYLSPRCGGPIYPTILNPIPECGELASSQPPKVLPKPSSLQVGQRLLATNNHSVNYVQQQQQQNNRLQLEKAENSRSKQQTGISVKSKMPTNHYVINDVQYAKISRNIRAKYESCL